MGLAFVMFETFLHIIIVDNLIIITNKYNTNNLVPTIQNILSY